jgi:hypothetical protein
MQELLFNIDEFFTSDELKQLGLMELEIYKIVRSLTREKKAVFIPGNVPSLKNSKEIVQMFTKQSVCCNAALIKNGKTLICSKCKKITQRKTRSSLIASKTVREYKKKTEQAYIDARPDFMNIIKHQQRPYQIGLYIIRDSKRHYDFNNASHIIHDTIANDMTRKTSNGLYIKLMDKWIDDDDVDNLRPVCLGTHVDTKIPGCYIFVLNKDIYLTTILYNLKKL